MKPEHKPGYVYACNTPPRPGFCGKLILCLEISDVARRVVLYSQDFAKPSYSKADIISWQMNFPKPEVGAPRNFGLQKIVFEYAATADYIHLIQHGNIPHRGMILGGTFGFARNNVLYIAGQSHDFGPAHPAAVRRCLKNLELRLDYETEFKSRKPTGVFRSLPPLHSWLIAKEKDQTKENSPYIKKSIV